MSRIRARVPVEQMITGDELNVAGHCLRPVVRVTGRRQWQEGEAGRGEWGFVRLTPVEVVARDAAGRERHIAMHSPERAVLIAFGSAALAIGSVSLAIMFVRRSRHE